ncbi:DNA repair protein RadC [Geobacter sp.]|uniref:RadC family protein n=1 Tax=Geobacter sp. TaxID=46610 RepID=UPI0027B8CC8E|nr:DNA repair protein RadC [Geobacter sp.]
MQHGNHTSKGIVSWPEDERPRERLLSRGAQALTDAELVAILIRVGFKGTSAVELGRQLLQQFGSLRVMVEAPVIALLDVKGLKGAKAAQLLAAMEIARRVAIPTKRSQLVIKSTVAAAEYLRDRMRGISEEHFRVLYLNRRNALLDDALIAQGSVDAVRPPLRTIVARALQVNASALIAAHNHPSGAANASESDRLLTQDLIAACRPIGLKLLDHVVVGEEATFSFADSGLLDELELLCMAPATSTRQQRIATLPELMPERPL